MDINLYEIRLEPKIFNNKTLVDAFCFDSQCALFLIDMNNHDSFHHVKDMIFNINDEKYPYLHKIIVENKSDISTKTPNEELQRILREYSSIDNIKISVKTGDNIDNLLNKIYDEVNSPENNVFPINKVSKCQLKDYSKKDCKRTFSLTLIGESAVGKTNFMSRYAKNSFNSHFMSNIGVNNEYKKVKINDKDLYYLTIWDTAGQEQFRSIPRKYYLNADGIFLMFDVNDKNTFEEVSFWINDINESRGETEGNNGETEQRGFPIFLIGNKIDLVENEEEKITREEKEEFAKKIGVKYYEVSCKWNLNIEEVMARMILDCLNTVRHRSKSFVLTKDNNNKRDKKGGCCSSSKKESNFK